MLGVERVGVDDNFFDLGGDSIISLQVVSRARRAGLALTSRDVFLNPTVAARAGRPPAGERAGVLAEQGPLSGPVPALPASAGSTRRIRPRPGTSTSRSPSHSPPRTTRPRCAPP
ncbi:phosphopantetheine-binding protein [Streptomyces albidoflavus]